MPSLAGMVYGLLAACSFDAAASPAFLVQRGFAAAITRTGVGDYTLTLSDGCNFNTEAVVYTGLNGNAGGFLSVEPLTTTTCRVRIFNAAAAAADIDFWMAIQKIAP
jgi:hypothetical protein